MSAMQLPANTHPRNLGRVHKSQLQMAYIHLQPAAMTESCSAARKSKFRFSEVGQGRTASNPALCHGTTPLLSMWARKPLASLVDGLRRAALLRQPLLFN